MAYGLRIDRLRLAKRSGYTDPDAIAGSRWLGDPDPDALAG
jgi:hypothetical protein